MRICYVPSVLKQTDVISVFTNPGFSNLPSVPPENLRITGFLDLKDYGGKCVLSVSDPRCTHPKGIRSGAYLISLPLLFHLFSGNYNTSVIGRLVTLKIWLECSNSNNYF